MKFFKNQKRKLLISEQWIGLIKRILFRGIWNLGFIPISWLAQTKRKRKDFRWMVKKCYMFDKETGRLMKLVKQKKLNRTGSWQSKEIST